MHIRLVSSSHCRTVSLHHGSRILSPMAPRIPSDIPDTALDSALDRRTPPPQGIIASPVTQNMDTGGNGWIPAATDEASMQRSGILFHTTSDCILVTASWYVHRGRAPQHTCRKCIRSLRSFRTQDLLRALCRHQYQFPYHHTSVGALTRTRYLIFWM